MSANNEINEAANVAKPADNNVLQGCLDDIRNNVTPKDYQGMLLPAESKTGCLPNIALFDSQAGVMHADSKGGDVPPPPEIKPPSTSEKDLAKDGVKTSHDKDGNGKDITITDFPNGVTVWAGDSKGEHVRNGHKIETMVPNMVTGVEAHEEPKGSGTFVDSHHKKVYTANEDGSTTVYTKDGVYTARTDGSVRKETALKDPKTGEWTVMDTDNPLGNMKPSDMGSVNKSSTQHRH